MENFAKDVISIRIEDEMRNSYMDYSMSVIIGRALPVVRDGLKPVHRRILYAMHREGLHASKKYSKCAGVVGEVLKKYHPHGDGAVYDALVRMAQPWNLRYMLVDGQGNFGSVDGDPAAAYRYTECKMTRLAEEMLVDIDKETVGFNPNFDGTTEEPTVMPARFPSLLVNGADGIAVGMATKIPPHNLGEVVDGCLAQIENPEISISELMEYIPAPDFPTGATIYGRSGVRDAYETGRGRIIVRGHAFFEDLSNGRRAIIIDELPYQVNKSRLVEQIADLVRDKRVDGIHTLRDESDRQGMRIVVELKYDVYEDVILNHLFKHTPLQSTYGVILLAIVNKRPRVLTLKEMLAHYISHRREVLLRRTRFELAKAQERAHILEGYQIALDNLDAIIALIRASSTPVEARAGLIREFQFSDLQAQAILEMRLQRLTGMERQKIEEEYQALRTKIEALQAILGSEGLLMNLVREELLEVRESYADERRTRIVDAQVALSIRDLVPEEDQVVTLSQLGYVKRCRMDEWRSQRRGGVGKKGMRTRDSDFVKSIFIANTHSVLLVFTTAGKVFPLNVYELPESGRNAKGRPIINLLSIPKDEEISGLVTLESDDGRISGDDDSYLLFISRKGLVKRTATKLFLNLRQGGMIACGVADEDALLTVRRISVAETHVMMLSKEGKCIRYDISDVPSFGRSARGNRGMALSPTDEIIDALLVPPQAHGSAEDEEENEDEFLNDDSAPGTTLLTVTELGYGKRTPFHQYRLQGRYGKGVMSYRTSATTGSVVGALEVANEDEVMLVTNTGRVIRISASSVRMVGRVSQGVRLMRLEAKEKIVDITRIEDEDEDVEEGEEVTGLELEEVGEE